MNTHRSSSAPSASIILAALLTTVAMPGCGGRTEEHPSLDSAETGSMADGITADDLATYTRELADDALHGRAPAGDGEAATLEYLQAAYERIGLSPVGGAALPGAADGAARFFQEVGMVAITADLDTADLSFGGSSGAETMDLRYRRDFVTWTSLPEAELDVSGGLVFVGYGIDAPEENWDDFGDMDMTGKILLVLVNDPPLEDQERFGGKAMTYYGRWTYKIEEGARRGAAGVLVVHETEAAGYGWDVVQETWAGEVVGLPLGPESRPATPLKGWVSQDATRRILECAGLDFDELATAAAQQGFEPVDLGIVVSGHLENSIRTVTSYNVIGAVGGSNPESADEYIIYTAHWDHFGVGEPVDGDAIYNGAIDNATGTAALLEVAEAWLAARPAPRRSALFIATTAEERGLLGSTFYVRNPIVPLDKTLALINLDMTNVWGPTDDVMIFGAGLSTLDDVLIEVLAEQGRITIPDPDSDKGYFFVADHFPFVRAGVPALYVSWGLSFVGKPENFGHSVTEDYFGNRYHQPSDEFDPSWDFSGAAQDLEALLEVGLRLSAAAARPEWRPESEFNSARDAMLHRRP